ncbi:unnamed protein product, partial [Sphacelaria rigidula]
PEIGGKHLTGSDCGKTGHSKSECPEHICEVCADKGHFKGFYEMAAMCTRGSLKDSVDFGSVSIETETGENSSTADSVQDDRLILDDRGKEVWIADSGVTCHMTPPKE